MLEKAGCYMLVAAGGWLWARQEAMTDTAAKHARFIARLAAVSVTAS